VEETLAERRKITVSFYVLARINVRFWEGLKVGGCPRELGAWMSAIHGWLFHGVLVY